MDDKLFAANETGMTAEEEVSKKYDIGSILFEDNKCPKREEATLNPTVMNTMDDIIAFVADLIEKAWQNQKMCISSPRN